MSMNKVQRQGANGAEETSQTMIEYLRNKDKDLSRKMAVAYSSESQYGFLRPLMLILEYSGHGFPWFAVTIIGLFVCHQPLLLEIIMNLLLALLIDVLVIVVIKPSVARQRPSYNRNDMMMVAQVDRYSFPSGHATRVTILACFFIQQVFPGQPWIAFFIILWSGLVSISRVVLGRHHVFDVVCGILIGLIDYFILLNIWISQEKCMAIIQPLHEELHL